MPSYKFTLHSDQAIVGEDKRDLTVLSPDLAQHALLWCRERHLVTRPIQSPSPCSNEQLRKARR